LGIPKICTTRLYKYKSKLQLYQNIERLVDEHDVKSFHKHLNSMGSSFARDMKNGMQVKGTIIPTCDMIKTIVDAFPKFKQNAINRPRRPRRPETIPALNTTNALNTESTDDSHDTTTTSKASTTNNDSSSVSPTVVMSNLTIIDHQELTSDPPLDQQQQEDGGDGDINLNDPNRESSTSSDSLGLNVVRSRRNSNKRSIEDSDSDEDMVDNHDGNTHSNTNHYSNMNRITSTNPNAPIRKKRVASICTITSNSNHNHNSNSANPTTNSHSNTNSHQDRKGRHEQDKSRSLGRVQYATNNNGVKVRSGLDCPYPRCTSKLQLLTAIHINCFGGKSLMQCMHCKTVIHNAYTDSHSADLMYYHCIDGCVNRGHVLSHQYYLCARCADQQCKSPQIFLPIVGSKQLAFGGVFTLFTEKGKQCRILTISQESNRVSFKSQTGNTFIDRQRDLFHGTISKMKGDGNDGEHIQLKLALDQDGSAKTMGQREAILKVMNRDDHRSVMLIFQGQSQQKKYHKAMPQCPKCNVDMVFMSANTVPNHRKYNTKCTNLKCHGNVDYDPMKYATMKAMNYVSKHEDITKQWYFHCHQCHDYSLCAGCTLIGHEKGIKDRYRRRRGMNRRDGSVRSSSMTMSGYGNGRRKRSYAEMNGGKEDDEVTMLRKQVQQLKRERDQWKGHYEKLKNLLNCAEEYHKKVIKRS